MHPAGSLRIPLPLILLLRSTDWPNWLQYASIPLSPNTDYIWQHWLHCALYMRTSSSPVNLLMDFVGACQGNHRLQHPHPCVPCIVPVKPSTEHWKPWLVGWLTLQNKWHHSGSWRPLAFTRVQSCISARTKQQIWIRWQRCVRTGKTPFSTSFSMFLQHEDIWSIFASYALAPNSLDNFER